MKKIIAWLKKKQKDKKMVELWRATQELSDEATRRSHSEAGLENMLIVTERTKQEMVLREQDVLSAIAHRDAFEETFKAQVAALERIADALQAGNKEKSDQ